MWGLGANAHRPPLTRKAAAKAEGAKEGHKGGRHGVLHGSNYHPPFAAIVVDDNTGQTIYEVNADEPRHPASVTKVMNLYLLFEELEAGKVALDTMLPVSAHCAGQAPVKLGLKPNSTIRAEDALKAMVTKSANDAACVVAELHGGGDEGEGARLMTAKAHALGMTSTNYVNGSGLPDEAQITTARDQALLGLIIRNRFPGYYRYFSTLSFNWHGKEMHNHNGLLGNVQGVDGIKTGYTEASGYNLVASVQRGDRHIVSVVLGGTSNGARDTADAQAHRGARCPTPRRSAPRRRSPRWWGRDGQPDRRRQRHARARSPGRRSRRRWPWHRHRPRRRSPRPAARERERRWRTDDGFRHEGRSGAQGRPGFPLVPEGRQAPRAGEAGADQLLQAAADPGRGAGFVGRACGSSALEREPDPDRALIG